MRCHSFASYGAKTVNNIEKVSVKQIVVPNKDLLKYILMVNILIFQLIRKNILVCTMELILCFLINTLIIKKEATNIKYFSIEEMIGYRRNYIS